MVGIFQYVISCFAGKDLLKMRTLTGFFTNKSRSGPNIEPSATSDIFGHLVYCNREGIEGWDLDLARPRSQLTICDYLDGKEFCNARTDYSQIGINNSTGLTTHCCFMLRWDRWNLAEAIKSCQQAVLVRLKSAWPTMSGDSRPTRTPSR